MLNPKNGEDTADVPYVPPVVAARRCQEAARDSPALPKRHPVKRLESLDQPKESIKSLLEIENFHQLHVCNFMLFSTDPGNADK